MVLISSTVSSVLAPPVPYSPTYEVPEDDEAQTTVELIETMRKIAEKTFADGGRPLRSVHAKSHGLLRARLEVLPGLPPELAQGVFAHSLAYPVAMRFSSIPGDLLPDAVSTPRGLSIKIVGVEGERLPGSEGDVTQDFLLVNGPAFSASGPKKFLGGLKLLAATTDRAPGLKKALSTALQGVEKVVEAVGGESAMLKALGGHPQTNLLGDTYYTQVPMLHGPYMAKLQIVPVSAGLRALTGAKVDLADRPDALREAVVEHFATQGGEWEVRVQLCRDIATMPVEDASVEWPQEQSPYLPVARIVAAPQVAWSVERSQAVDDGLSFSPWHGLKAHRPIGGVMRARKLAYEAAKAFRGERNRQAMNEPKTLDGLLA